MTMRSLLALASVVAAAGPVTAATLTYHCLPVNVEENLVALLVTCAEPSGFEGGLPWDGMNRIRRFGVAKSDTTFGPRFLHIAQTALTAGMIMRLQYTSGSSSGNPFGCDASDCRRPTVVGLLAPASSVRIPYARWPSNADYAISAGQLHHFGPFSIGPTRRLVVKMTGTGNADLYLQPDMPVLPENANCRPARPDSNETCSRTVDPGDKSVTYYVAVGGIAANSTYKLSVTIETLP
jgi:hypothetical protein